MPHSPAHNKGVATPGFKRLLQNDRWTHLQPSLSQGMRLKTTQSKWTSHHSKDQLVDILTKALGRIKFESCRNKRSTKKSSNLQKEVYCIHELVKEDFKSPL